MIVYNQAYDVYYTIFRMIHLLYSIRKSNSIDLDRLRIYDFYLLFPSASHNMTIKRNEGDIRQLRKDLIDKNKNPFEILYNQKKIFDNIKNFQITSLRCLSSFGLINNDFEKSKTIIIEDNSLLEEAIDNIGKLTSRQKNMLIFIQESFSKFPMTGVDGIKNRTKLMESKYDAE